MGCYRRLAIMSMGRLLPPELEMMVNEYIAHDRYPKRQWTWDESLILEGKRRRSVDKANGAERGGGISIRTVLKYWAGVALAPIIVGLLARLLKLLWDWNLLTC